VEYWNNGPDETKSKKISKDKKTMFPFKKNIVPAFHYSRFPRRLQVINPLKMTQLSAN